MAQQLFRPRRLLIVTYHFPPSGAVAAFRMLGFARHLPRNGWQVGVVAPPSVPGEPVDEALLDRVPPGTTVFAAPYPRSWPARLARRVAHHGVWLPSALPVMSRAVRKFRPDAVLTSGPPHCVHFIGLLLKRYCKLPWVADFRDPFFTNRPPVKGFSPQAEWDQFWEGHIAEQADAIIANTPLGYQGFQEAYPRHRHKMVLVTNGFDPELFPPPGPPVSLNGRLTMLHAGELYSGRDARPILDAIKAVDAARPASVPPIRLRLLGQSTENRFNLHTAIHERDLDNVVELGGQVPYAAALAAMTKADLLLLVDTPGRRIGIPAKLFEYLGASRPILALTEPDSDAARTLRASGMPHRIVPPLDAAKIQQALAELREGLLNRRFVLPPSDQLATFTRGHLAQSLVCQLDHVLLRKRPVHSHEHEEEGLLANVSIDPFEGPYLRPTPRRPRHAGA